MKGFRVNAESESFILILVCLNHLNCLNILNFDDVHSENAVFSPVQGLWDLAYFFRCIHDNFRTHQPIDFRFGRT